MGWCGPFGPAELLLYHQLAVTYHRTPHELVLNRLDVPGEAVHGACLVFDVFCMHTAAEYSKAASSEVSSG